MKPAFLVAVSFLLSLTVRAQTNSYAVIPIVDSTVDEFLINPWGLSRPVDPSLGENQWWVSDNATGFTTLYAANTFSEPWGIALAPDSFGAFSNMLLVSNTTSGMIGAYNPTTGAFQDFLRGANGSPIVLPSIWGISFGNGHPESGPTSVLYYSAGGEDETTGEFGEIAAN
ncbi:MAG: TIGR03118 family protein [Verrucomicrobiota bacterium]|nr:TIGR03118 family protein [Verrucomicrobiota bacterium]